jgi:hypothetical protein
LIEIIFISLIGILFFWDLITFYNKNNLRIHRIILPIGLLGTLTYTHFSNQNLFIAIKNSLSILIISLIAFLIILFIKLFLTHKNIKKEEKITKNNNVKNSNIEILSMKKLEDKLQLIDNKIENLNFDKKLDNIEKKLLNKNKIIDEINEIKTIINFWTKRFDEDTKIFHNETLLLKKENKAQLSLIIKLLYSQSKEFEDKIKFFEKQLYKIENKKISLNDNIINNLLDKIESYLNHIKIEVSTMSNNFDEIYLKEDNLFNQIIKMENKIHKLDISIEELNTISNNIRIQDEKFEKILNNFTDIKHQFESIIEKIENNNDENTNKVILKELSSLEIKIEEILNNHQENIKEKINPILTKNEIVLKNYTDNLK